MLTAMFAEQELLEAATRSVNRQRMLQVGAAAAAALLVLDAASADSRKLDPGAQHLTTLQLLVTVYVHFLCSSPCCWLLPDGGQGWPTQLSFSGRLSIQPHQWELLAEALEELTKDLHGHHYADRERSVSSLSGLTIYLEHHEALLAAGVLPALMASVQDERAVPQVYPATFLAL